MLAGLHISITKIPPVNGAHYKQGLNFSIASLSILQLFALRKFGRLDRAIDNVPKVFSQSDLA
jgi:hypothetical protein